MNTFVLSTIINELKQFRNSNWKYVIYIDNIIWVSLALCAKVCALKFEMRKIISGKEENKFVFLTNSSKCVEKTDQFAGVDTIVNNSKQSIAKDIIVICCTIMHIISQISTSIRGVMREAYS